MIVTPVEVKVSKPYRVVGLHGGNLRPRRWDRRTYTAEVFGSTLVHTSKEEIKRLIRFKAFQHTGSRRVDFTFTEEEN